MQSLPFTVVIGAGPSGLVACKTLAEWGIPYLCFEAGNRVGGQWVLGSSSGMSSAYRSLRANTHTGMCRYADFGFPDGAAPFPTHEQMAAWFDSYADHFGLREHIRLGARVERVERREAEAGGWRLRLASGEQTDCDALVVAVGNLWDPRSPELTGEFEGELIHAKQYMDPRDPVDCLGKRVCVVGLGNTACELAVELCQPGVASEVLLSCRSGQTFLPKLNAPVPHPSEPLTGLLRRLPGPARQLMFRALFPRILGKLTAARPRPEDVGLPAPPKDLFEKRVVVNDHILERLRDGAIRAKPGIRKLSGTKIEFADGSREEVDVLITATGYRFSLPFFQNGLTGYENNDLRLYRGLMHPHFHDLFVIGVMKAVCSIWPRSEQQMRFIAPLLAGDYALPSQRKIERDSYPVLGVPYGNCQFHSHELQQELARGRRRSTRGD